MNHSKGVERILNEILAQEFKKLVLKSTKESTREEQLKKLQGFKQNFFKLSKKQCRNTPGCLNYVQVLYELTMLLDRVLCFLFEEGLISASEFQEWKKKENKLLESAS